MDDLHIMADASGHGVLSGKHQHTPPQASIKAEAHGHAPCGSFAPAPSTENNTPTNGAVANTTAFASSRPGGVRASRSARSKAAIPLVADGQQPSTAGSGRQGLASIARARIQHRELRPRSLSSRAIWSGSRRTQAWLRFGCPIPPGQAGRRRSTSRVPAERWPPSKELFGEQTGTAEVSKRQRSVLAA